MTDEQPPAPVGWPQTVRDIGVAVIVTLAFVALPVLVVREYVKTTDQDLLKESAVAVNATLGVVVPALVSFGAAIFGVTISYRSAQKEKKAAENRAEAEVKAERADSANKERTARGQGEASVAKHVRELLAETEPRLRPGYVTTSIRPEYQDAMTTLDALFVDIPEIGPLIVASPDPGEGASVLRERLAEAPIASAALSEVDAYLDGVMARFEDG